jgi:hypothetical protein
MVPLSPPPHTNQPLVKITLKIKKMGKTQNLHEESLKKPNFRGLTKRTIEEVEASGTCR